MRRTIVILCLAVAGCGKCGSCHDTPTSTSTGASGPSCCDIEPSRAALLASSAKAAEVELKTVKLDQLVEALKAQSGKIVVLDVWGDFCAPCKKEFPHLVKLHEEHARDGVVCMSLSVDEPESKDAALKFLKAKNATFPNFHIDEPAAAWQEHFLLKGVPAVIVIGRDGKEAARFTNDDSEDLFTYAQVEKKVVELLQSK